MTDIEIIRTMEKILQVPLPRLEPGDIEKFFRDVKQEKKKRDRFTPYSTTQQIRGTFAAGVNYLFKIARRAPLNHKIRHQNPFLFNRDFID